MVTPETMIISIIGAVFGSTGFWAQVLIPDPEVIPEWIQPESTNPYMKGDKVKHNEKTWICDIDNNVWEPGTYGWTEVA